MYNVVPVLYKVLNNITLKKSRQKLIQIAKYPRGWSHKGGGRVKNRPPVCCQATPVEASPDTGGVSGPGDV